MTSRGTIYQSCNARFVPGIIRFAYTLGAVMLVSTANAHASSVSNPPNRSTLWSYPEQETNGEEMFSLYSANPQPDRADDHVGVRDVGVTDLNFDGSSKPDQKDQRRFVQHKNTDKHKPKNNDDDGPFVFDRGGDFNAHEDKDNCPLCGKGIGRPCDTAPVPLPGTAWLFGTGLLGFSVMVRVKQGTAGGQSLGWRRRPSYDRDRIVSVSQSGGVVYSSRLL